MDFTYTLAELMQQSDAQPLLLSLWLDWLIFINLVPPLFFIRHLQARWVLYATLIMLALNFPLSLMFGFSKILALPHILVWTPLIAYLAYQWKYNLLPERPLLKGWILLLMITNLISLVFDFRDGFQYLFLDDRGIILADISDIPYKSFGAIIIALAITLTYSLRRRKVIY